MWLTILKLQKLTTSERFSSGIVEGFNNNAKLNAKNVYGFRTDEAFEIALYHQFGKLPEPDSLIDSDEQAVLIGVECVPNVVKNRSPRGSGLHAAMLSRS